MHDPELGGGGERFPPANTPLPAIAVGVTIAPSAASPSAALNLWCALPHALPPQSGWGESNTGSISSTHTRQTNSIFFCLKFFLGVSGTSRRARPCRQCRRNFRKSVQVKSDTPTKMVPFLCLLASSTVGTTDWDSISPFLLQHWSNDLPSIPSVSIVPLFYIT